MNVYRGMTREALDAAYNNSAAVVDSPAILQDWEARSERLRAAYPEWLDLRYGPAERNRIDYFQGTPGGPVLIFIHGGYWQMRAKETFSFLAAGPLAHGVHVAFAGYTLAPQKRLDGIVAEIADAIDWLAARIADFGGDPQRVIVAGWSAGGHLAAMSIAEPAVRGGLAISGIYDLEPIRRSYLNDKLGLDVDEAQRNSPLLHLPRSANPLIVTCGGDELPELQRQSEVYAKARADAGLPGRLITLTGHNHFTILEELAHPDGALTRAMRELVDA